MLRTEAAVESQLDVIPKRRAPQYASQRGKLRGAGMDREYAKHKVSKRDPPNDPHFLAMRARVYTRMGKRAEAKGVLKALKPHKPDLRPAAYAALGDNDEAFRL